MLTSGNAPAISSTPMTLLIAMLSIAMLSIAMLSCGDDGDDRRIDEDDDDDTDT